MVQFPMGQNTPGLVEPPGGWKSFIDTNWERQSAFFPNSVSSPLIDSNRAFRAVVNCCEVERKGAMEHHVAKQRARFYVEHAAISRDLPQYLPDASDGSLEGYCDRMTRFLNNRDFTLVVNDLQAVDFDLWSSMRAFLSGLYESVGLPLETSATLYLSKSRTTAIGIHKDPVSNFLFQLAGTKVFRLWPTHVIESKPEIVRTLDFESIASDAITVDVKPSDLLYIPSDFFHMAEANDSLSVHLSILIGTGKDAWHLYARRLLSMVLRRRMSTLDFPAFLSIDPQQPNGGRLTLPAPYKALADVCTNLGDEIQAALVEELMRLTTSFGCHLSPPLREWDENLLDDDSIELDSQSAFAYHLFKDRVYMASNGRGFSCPAHPLVIELLKQLNNSRSSQVSWLLSTYSGRGMVAGVEAEFSKDDAKNILRNLYRIQAIRKVSATT